MQIIECPLPACRCMRTDLPLEDKGLSRNDGIDQACLFCMSVVVMMHWVMSACLISVVVSATPRRVALLPQPFSLAVCNVWLCADERLALLVVAPLSVPHGSLER